MISAYKALAIATACQFDMYDMMFELSDGAGCAPDQECKLTTRPIRPALANSFGPDSMFISDVWTGEFIKKINVYGKL